MSILRAQHILQPCCQSKMAQRLSQLMHDRQMTEQFESLHKSNTWEPPLAAGVWQRFRHRAWLLLEKPHSSLAARVRPSLYLYLCERAFQSNYGIDCVLLNALIRGDA